MRIFLLHSLKKNRNRTRHQICIFRTEVLQNRTLCLKKQQPQTVTMFRDQSDIFPADYGKARAGVAISDSPTGPFKLLGTYKLHDSADANHSWDNVGGAVRDMNLFKDDDGQAYVIYSSDGNLTTYIAKLNADYTGLITDPADAVEGTGKEGEELTASDYTRNFIDASREAPAMFKYKDKYYIINSGCTGWSPNKAQYAVADHPLLFLPKYPIALRRQHGESAQQTVILLETTKNRIRLIPQMPLS